MKGSPFDPWVPSDTVKEWDFQNETRWARESEEYKRWQEKSIEWQRGFNEWSEKRFALGYTHALEIDYPGGPHPTEPPKPGPKPVPFGVRFPQPAQPVNPPPGAVSPPPGIPSGKGPDAGGKVTASFKWIQVPDLKFGDDSPPPIIGEAVIAGGVVTDIKDVELFVMFDTGAWMGALSNPWDTIRGGYEILPIVGLGTTKATITIVILSVAAFAAPYKGEEAVRAGYKVQATGYFSNAAPAPDAGIGKILRNK